MTTLIRFFILSLVLCLTDAHLSHSGHRNSPIEKSCALLLLNENDHPIQKAFLSEGGKIKPGENFFPLPGGTTGPGLLVTLAGKHVLKPTFFRKWEVPAYLISRELELGNVPYAEFFKIGKEGFSAQAFMEDSIGEWKRVLPSSPIAPDDLIILLDALTGNTDRGYHVSNTSRANYFIYVNEKGESFQVALDNAAGSDDPLKEWLHTYSGFATPTTENISKLIEIVKRNPQFVQKLSAWSEKQITLKIGGYLSRKQLKGVLNRRRELLDLGSH